MTSFEAFPVCISGGKCSLDRKLCDFSQPNIPLLVSKLEVGDVCYYMQTVL